MLVIYNLFQTVGYYGFSSWVPTLLDFAGHRRHEIARLYFHHRRRGADRPAGRRLLCRPVRAQMADRLGRHRHRRVRPVVRAADQRAGRDRLRRVDHAVQQLDVVLVPRLSGRAVSDPHPRPRGGLRLFVEPVFSAIFSGFIIAFFLGRYGTIGVFGFIAGAMVVVFVVIGGYGPAVTKRRLEAIAA